MGFNSTIMILNDALHFIGDDKDFGRKVERAILDLNLSPNPIDISSGTYINAAVAIEQHHSSMLMPVLVGCNYGYKLDQAALFENNLVFNKEDLGESLMRTLADHYGYYLRKKPIRKK